MKKCKTHNFGPVGNFEGLLWCDRCGTVRTEETRGMGFAQETRLTTFVPGKSPKRVTKEYKHGKETTKSK